MVDALKNPTPLSLECTMASCLFQNCQLQKCVVCVSRIDLIVIKINSIVIKIDSICCTFDSVVSKIAKNLTQCKTIDLIMCHVSLDILTIYWFYLVRVDFYYNWVNSSHNWVNSSHNGVDSGDTRNTFLESTILKQMACHSVYVPLVSFMHMWKLTNWCVRLW